MSKSILSCLTKIDLHDSQVQKAVKRIQFRKSAKAAWSLKDLEYGAVKYNQTFNHQCSGGPQKMTCVIGKLSPHQTIISR